MDKVFTKLEISSPQGAALRTRPLQPQRRRATAGPMTPLAEREHHESARVAAQLAHDVRAVRATVRTEMNNFLPMTSWFV